jgi:hypothetical protein
MGIFVPAGQVELAYSKLRLQMWNPISPSYFNPLSHSWPFFLFHSFLYPIYQLYYVLIIINICFLYLLPSGPSTLGCIWLQTMVLLFHHLHSYCHAVMLLLHQMIYHPPSSLINHPSLGPQNLLSFLRLCNFIDSCLSH